MDKQKNISENQIFNKIRLANDTGSLSFTASLQDEQKQRILNSMNTKNSDKKGFLSKIKLKTVGLAAVCALLCFVMIFSIYCLSEKHIKPNETNLLATSLTEEEFKNTFNNVLYLNIPDATPTCTVFVTPDAKLAVYAKITYVTKDEEWDEHLLLSDDYTFTEQKSFSNLKHQQAIKGISVKYNYNDTEAFAKFNKNSCEYFIRYKNLNNNLNTAGDKNNHGTGPNGEQLFSTWDKIQKELSEII